jgi:nucleotide-binding universal stress UspA family protein
MEGEAMTGHVLVTLDGSTLSEAILPVVADRFAGTDAVVTLLSVGEIPQATAEEPTGSVQPYVFLGAPRPAVQLETRRYAETKEQALGRRADQLMVYLEQKAETLRERGIEVRTVVEFGDPSQVISELAARPEVDLVAMATHGHTGLAALIFGSVTGRVLFSGVRPMLLVRPRSNAKGWKADAAPAASGRDAPR